MEPSNNIYKDDVAVAVAVAYNVAVAVAYNVAVDVAHNVAT